MARLLNLLVICSVLWCGLHLMEPAGTVAGLIDIAHGEGVPGDCPDADDESGQVAHAGHHHCPAAPAQRLDAGSVIQPPATALIFARSAEAMPSRAAAPPLQPPTS